MSVEKAGQPMLPGPPRAAPQPPPDEIDGSIPPPLVPLHNALFLATLLLGMFSGAMVLVRTGAYPPPVVAGYVVVLGLLIWGVFQLRPFLADTYRDLGAGEKLALAIFSLLVFLAPSFALSTWAPLTGLAALMVPTVLGLVGPPGFARFYMLCGLCVALAAARIPPDRAVPILVAFLVLLVSCLALEGWFFSLTGRERRASGVRRPSIGRTQVLALAAGRLFLAMACTVPVAAYLAQHNWNPPAPRPNRPLPRLAQSLEMDLSLLQLLVQSVVIMLGAICLALLYKWLESRRPKPAGEVEMVATPLSESIEEARPAPRRRQRRAPESDARETLLLVFDQMAERLKKYGLERLPAQTFGQWAVQPGGDPPSAPSPRQSPPAPPEPGNAPRRMPWPTDTAEEMARAISQRAAYARYAAIPPTWDEVKEFDRLCTRLVKHLKNPGRDQPRA